MNDPSTFHEAIAGQSNLGNVPPKQRLDRVLSAIRTHLGMDVAFISQFKDRRRVFRHVDTDDAAATAPVQVGDSDPIEESYCQRVAEGRLPELITDASLFPAARELPVTDSLPVGAHMSVPIKLKDGRTYGTFCCFSYTPDPSLRQRDLNIMRVFADFAAEEIDQDMAARQFRRVKEKRIKAVLSEDALSMVYQPIYKTMGDGIRGFEALARFSAQPFRTPDVWFKEAAEVGAGVRLETEALRRGLAALVDIPQHIYVAVNVSPAVILHGGLADVLQAWPLDRIVLELTEHAAIDHYGALSAVLRPMREQGLRIAVDDAGAGYASFRHILRLAPDVIKLDMSLTRDIDSDLSRRALAEALISFARMTGCTIVAEGVETASELSTLHQLGVEAVQGYYLGKPMPLSDAIDIAQSKTDGANQIEARCL